VLTSEARSALLDYYREKIDLMAEIDRMLLQHDLARLAKRSHNRPPALRRGCPVVSVSR